MSGHPSHVLELCAGAGHMLMMERPAEVTVEIARVAREAAGGTRTAGPPDAPDVAEAA